LPRGPRAVYRGDADPIGRAADVTDTTRRERAAAENIQDTDRAGKQADDNSAGVSNRTVVLDDQRAVNRISDSESKAYGEVAGLGPLAPIDGDGASRLTADDRALADIRRPVIDTDASILSCCAAPLPTSSPPLATNSSVVAPGGIVATCSTPSPSSVSQLPAAPTSLVPPIQ